METVLNIQGNLEEYIGKVPKQSVVKLPQHSWKTTRKKRKTQRKGGGKSHIKWKKRHVRNRAEHCEKSFIQ